MTKMSSSSSPTTSGISKERRERWAQTIAGRDKYQTWSFEPPTDEQGFLQLTLITPNGPARAFVATEAVKMLMSRKAKYIEYYATGPDGGKVAVSLEWVGRDEAWVNLSDKDIQEIGQMTKQIPPEMLCGAGSVAAGGVE